MLVIQLIYLLIRHPEYVLANVKVLMESKVPLAYYLLQDVLPESTLPRSILPSIRHTLPHDM